MNTKSGLKHIETITEADEEEEESQIRDILKERINSHFGSGLEKWQKAMEETARNDEQESMSTRYLLLTLISIYLSIQPSIYSV